MKCPPVLVLAVGNPSRGDDALGPLLLERLAATGMDAADDVELLTDFQLQVEHALDLEGRRAVLFVDAARPGSVNGVCLKPIRAEADVAPVSHALSAPAVLHVATLLSGRAPPAWLLAVEGDCFALKEGLSPLAQQRLEQAFDVLLGWLATQRAADA